tara:strand:+ start:122 stop:973 length:852 start_codon:yes stop_codon:yes gene_type:complete
MTATAKQTCIFPFLATDSRDLALDAWSGQMPPPSTVNLKASVVEEALQDPHVTFPLPQHLFGLLLRCDADTNDFDFLSNTGLQDKLEKTHLPLWDGQSTILQHVLQNILPNTKNPLRYCDIGLVHQKASEFGGDFETARRSWMLQLAGGHFDSAGLPAHQQPRAKTQNIEVHAGPSMYPCMDECKEETIHTADGCIDANDLDLDYDAIPKPPMIMCHLGIESVGMMLQHEHLLHKIGHDVLEHVLQNESLPDIVIVEIPQNHCSKDGIVDVLKIICNMFAKDN